MQINEVVKAIDHIAPFSSALDWDNCGLLVGNGEEEVTGILVCLDATLPAIQEAVEEGCNLIVTHHPVIFQGQKKFCSQNPAFEAARSGVAILCAHTNYDMAKVGINQALASKIGLTNIVPLLRQKKQKWKKIVTFAPFTHVEHLYKSLVAVGCGTLGDYAGCAFLARGEGRFMPMDDAHPFLGQPGRLEQVEECRLEMIFPGEKEQAVLESLHKNHPYEEPAYDIFTTDAVATEHWLGCVGTLLRPETEDAFAQRIEQTLGIVPCYNPGHRLITKVGVCGGSGGEVMAQAKAAHGWDYQAFVTGEVKHHQFIEAQAMGITLYDATHYATEAIAMPQLADQLRQACPEIKVKLANAYHGEIHG